MSQAKTRNQPPPNSRQEKVKRFSPFNVMMKPIGVTFTILWYIGLSILIGTIIEWIGMSFFWESDHAAQVLKTEFDYLGDNFAMTLFGDSAENTALTIINTLSGWMWGDKGDPSAVMLAAKWAQNVIHGSAAYINAFFYIVMITAIRCVIIVLSSALVLIIAIAAIVDGLHERELRKLCGGNEHGDVYHWAKAWAPRILYFSPVLYLAWPTAINPNYIILPGLFAFFWAIYLFFSKYKKVL